MPDLIPEPPDGAALLWPATDADEVPLVLLRDDQMAVLWGDHRACWFAPNDLKAEPATWQQVVEAVEAGEYSMAEAVRLYAQAELDQAVADGGYEQIGEHRIALGAGRCVTHGETFTQPELDRLREREGGNRGD